MIVIKKIQGSNPNSTKQKFGIKANHIYETYKNMFIPHGRHIYAKAYDLAKEKMCAYPQSDHELTHWKFFMQCCAKRPSIILPDQGTDDQYTDTNPSITFQIYHLIACCSTHGRIPINYKNNCRKCRQDSASEKSTKIYTRKEIVMMETTISNFHKSFYIPAIQKLAFTFHVYK